ncbi:MAG: hypothetical protein SGILL_007744 [Bacillariaceae sp.]
MMLPNNRIPVPLATAARSHSSSVLQRALPSGEDGDGGDDAAKTFDALLNDSNNYKDGDDDDQFQAAVKFIQSHPTMEMTKERFGRIFDAIEEITKAAEQNAINTRMEQEVPMISQSRVEMTDMYDALKEAGHLRLFGSINRDNMPVSGSHTVRPSLMEQITLLSMKSLTPKPSNTLLYAGIVVATLEAIASASIGWDLNILFFATLSVALADRVLLNGAVSESVAKAISPETQPKIMRHEAGHFLCAYLLGLPIEGVVLSAFAALQDPRFGPRGVSAGTSFFDRDLSNQIANAQIKRSAIDRYSIVVMAGIAAEAIHYGQADGGAGDEIALISFLSNLNGDPSASSGPVWNDLSIRNQARYGALQAVLLLREYKECYDALVDALERGKTLGECIYAIEDAGRKFNKLPLEKPIGFIVESSDGSDEVFVKELPKQVSSNRESNSQAVPSTSTASNPEDSLESLRSMVTDKISDLDSQIEKLDKRR